MVCRLLVVFVGGIVVEASRTKFHRIAYVCVVSLHGSKRVAPSPCVKSVVSPASGCATTYNAYTYS